MCLINDMGVYWLSRILGLCTRIMSDVSKYNIIFLLINQDYKIAVIYGNENNNPGK